MILLRICNRFIIVYTFLIPLMIFIYADLPNEASKITMESEAVTKNDKTNGLFGYIALPFSFIKKIIFGKSPKTWEYIAKNVAVFAYEGKKQYPMEDRFFIDENFEGTGVSVYAIFDGRKGDYSAQYVASELMKSLEAKIIQLKKKTISDEHLKQKYMDNNAIKYLDLLKDEIKATDDKLLELLKKAENINEENKINQDAISSLNAATALIAIKEGSQLFAASIGSIPLVMGKTNGSAQRLTFEAERTGEKKLLSCFGDLHMKGSPNTDATIPNVGYYDLSELQSKFLIFAPLGFWNQLEVTDVVKHINDRYNNYKDLFGAKSIAFKAEKIGLEKIPLEQPDNFIVIILKTNT